VGSGPPPAAQTDADAENPTRPRGRGDALLTWLLAAVAAGAFALAALFSGLAPASECGTPHAIHARMAAAPFLLFVAAGGYVFLRGGAALRLLLFAWMALVLAAYVWTLGLALPMAFEIEIGCAQAGRR
jgi:hypothetical protein